MSVHTLVQPQYDDISLYNLTPTLMYTSMAATVFVQPLDLVKNRMQTSKVLPGGQKPTSMSVLMGVVKNEGFFTLYNGLSAGLLRQATYTTTRLGKTKIFIEDRRSCFCRSTLLQAFSRKIYQKLLPSHLES